MVPLSLSRWLGVTAAIDLLSGCVEAGVALASAFFTGFAGLLNLFCKNSSAAFVLAGAHFAALFGEPSRLSRLALISDAICGLSLLLAPLFLETLLLGVNMWLLLMLMLHVTEIGWNVPLRKYTPPLSGSNIGGTLRMARSAGSLLASLEASALERSVVRVLLGSPRVWFPLLLRSPPASLRPRRLLACFCYLRRISRVRIASADSWIRRRA